MNSTRFINLEIITFAPFLTSCNTTNKPMGPPPMTTAFSLSSYYTQTLHRDKPPPKAQSLL
jgi:hypothetical protein